MNSSFDFQVVTAVHSASRPIYRAVSSALKNQSKVGVIVVAHNIDPKVIVGNLKELATDGRVTILELQDNIHSPAGPYNFGLGEVTAEYFSTIGSDDELEPGAIDSWIEISRKYSSDVVIPKLKRVGGTTVPTPPSRPWRSHYLDGVSDRLSYRTAGQLGLIRRSAFLDFRKTEGLVRGEDIICSLKLWFSGKNISYDRNGPAYLVHPDAEDRVSYLPQALCKDFAFLEVLKKDSWFKSLDARQKESVVIKLIRTHLIDAVLNRASTQNFPVSERYELVRIAEAIIEVSEKSLGKLSRLDYEILELILSPEVPLQVIFLKIQLRKKLFNLKIWLPKKIRYLFDVNAPFRYYLGTFFAVGKH